MQIHRLTPQDVLFFRDARPMTFDQGSGGHGARWPEPHLVFDALHRRLHEAFPDQQDWECGGKVQTGKGGRAKDGKGQRFGSLSSVGLFPWPVSASGPGWLFRCPADVVKAETDVKASPNTKARVLQPLPSDDSDARTNLPFPWLRYVAASPEPPSKKTPPEWWSRAAWDAYLSEKPLPADKTESPKENEHLRSSADLGLGEWHTGIGMNPETQTQDGKRIYSAEYLRLRPAISFGFAATLPKKVTEKEAEKEIENLPELWTTSAHLPIGGDQRIASVEPHNEANRLGDFLPKSLPVEDFKSVGDSKEVQVKWILLTPAIYPAIADTSKSAAIMKKHPGGLNEHPGGWLPNWICPKSGNVLLLSGDTTRRPGEHRETWRNRIRKESKPIAAQLVAACIPKPIVITGYSRRAHRDGEKAGARETLLAVPAGAVYYFQAENETAAGELVAALSWHGKGDGSRIVNRRSTLHGEKGYGLGVCGKWSVYPGNPEPAPLDPSNQSQTNQRSA